TTRGPRPARSTPLSTCRGPSSWVRSPRPTESKWSALLSGLQRMEHRELIEIPLDQHDAELLPPLYAYFKSFWSDTSEEPRAKYNRFMSNTPIVDGVVFRPVAGSAPWGYGANR